MQILEERIPDKDILSLLDEIVGSFCVSENNGLPLGNLTSQLLVNVYMNEFDQFVKHTLKSKHYIRYADDFVLLSADKEKLDALLVRIDAFLREDLKLTLHPNKVSISTLASGVDFLGWVHFPTHRVLRRATKRRMFRTIKEKDFKEERVQSYLGLLTHGNGHKLSEQVERLRESAKLD
jgi:hypothetical protein